MTLIIRAFVATMVLAATWLATERLGGPSTVVEAGQAPAVAMVADEGEAARYWPRWRGPSGQGLVSGSGYTDRWSGTENILWKTSVPGAGNSSPIVWGDRIFVTT